MKRLILIIVVLFLVACEGAQPTNPLLTPAASPSISIGAPISPSPLTANSCIINSQVYCALNLDVIGNSLQDPGNNLAATICKPLWTRGIRPPIAWTDALKLSFVSDKGISPSDISKYELDHRMPLELGGAPGSPAPLLTWENVNLSLESPASPNPKDADENFLKNEVCANRLTLTQARQRLIDKWLGPGDQYKR
jgi:hypothetical protein